MNHFTWDQVPQLLAALLAAVSAFIAAWNSRQAVKTTSMVQATQLIHIQQTARAAAATPPPGAEAPGMGINDALRYWDLISKLKAAWSDVKGQPVGVMGSLPIIKGVKIDGRKADLGPTPIVFR